MIAACLSSENFRMHRFLLPVACSIACLFGSSATTTAGEGDDHFDARVRPVLSIYCYMFAATRREGLHPVARARQATRVRQIYFDLLGLTPTPEHVDAFVTDPAPDAWDRLVDRLLASPHYGERWGRHWIDV